jgi:hypothetical protein
MKGSMALPAMQVQREGDEGDEGTHGPFLSCYAGILNIYGDKEMKGPMVLSCIQSS